MTTLRKLGYLFSFICTNLLAGPMAMAWWAVAPGRANPKEDLFR